VHGHYQPIFARIHLHQPATSLSLNGHQAQHKIE